jgi:AcrR family transcriptional regulator
MKTAFVLFMQKSFKAVTLREIIAGSGFSNGAFYHYFRTKEELFIAVANRYWFEFINLPQPSGEGVTLKQFIEDSLQRSEMAINMIYEEFSIDGRTANFYSFVFEAYRIVPDFTEKMFQARARELDLWAGVIGNAKRTGEIRSDLPDATIVQLFVTISYGNAITHLVNEDKDDMKESFRAQWEGLYELLKV